MSEQVTPKEKIFTSSGKLEKNDTLGYVVMGSMILATIMLYYLNKRIKKKLHATHNV